MSVGGSDMPDMFDRLTAKVGEWKDAPPPDDFEMSSDRELSESDDGERVTVTMKNFEITQIEYSTYWFRGTQPTETEVAEATMQAVNKVMKRYWEEEMADAASHAIPMGEIYEGLKELSGDFRGAYERAMERLERYQ